MEGGFVGGKVGGVVLCLETFTPTLPKVDSSGGAFYLSMPANLVTSEIGFVRFESCAQEFSGILWITELIKLHLNTTLLMMEGGFVGGKVGGVVLCLETFTPTLPKADFSGVAFYLSMLPISLYQKLVSSDLSSVCWGVSGILWITELIKVCGGIMRVCSTGCVSFSLE
ncbi:hypothetical protein CDAR_482971 [Caerostris darwini]|uniref:Uncharacterized protein n=1 Tax=Caerostris darwini TaxID=1538125 RepID=A0AAV4MQU5_9ARAC|nr:hypothetical protein CDAR_482971 [Caerostris darwini]